jgi:hypothetical protein
MRAMNQTSGTRTTFLGPLKPLSVECLVDTMATVMMRPTSTTPNTATPMMMAFLYFFHLATKGHLVAYNIH